MSTCKSCGADIVWVRTKGGNSMPVDAPTTRLGDTTFDSTRHTSHFATCPNAKQHRKGEAVMTDELSSLRAEVVRLRKGYAEAIDDIESWAGYASEYFQSKHDLAGTLAQHRALLTGEGEGRGMSVHVDNARPRHGRERHKQ